MVVGEAGLEEIREARDAEGELRREAMRDARDLVSEVGEETVVAEAEGGTGMGDRVTSVVGSTGSEVMTSQYLSRSSGDINWYIGEKTGSRVLAGRWVMYVWKLWRWRVFRVQRTMSPTWRSA